MLVCNRCTHLTSLDLSMLQPYTLDTMFTVGSLPEGITALQRLQHLRLADCVTEPLARGIGQMTQLTSLEFWQRGPTFYAVNTGLVRWLWCEPLALPPNNAGVEHSMGGVVAM